MTNPLKMKNKTGIIIFIDTSSNIKIAVGIIIEGEKFIVEENITNRKAQVVLPMIKNILQKHSLLLQDISAIQVNKGPGSFTGVRVGVSIANALSFALNIPVNNKPLKELVEPIYS